MVEILNSKVGWFTYFPSPGCLLVSYLSKKKKKKIVDKIHRNRWLICALSSLPCHENWCKYFSDIQMFNWNVHNHHLRIRKFFVLFLPCMKHIKSFPIWLFHYEKSVISPNFLVWTFCGKVHFRHSFGRIARNHAETVHFHKISTPGN